MNIEQFTAYINANVPEAKGLQVKIVEGPLQLFVGCILKKIDSGIIALTDLDYQDDDGMLVYKSVTLFKY